MFKNLSKVCILLCLTFSLSYATSNEEVKIFVNEAVKLCKDKGNKACFKEFNNPKGSFIKGELYIFAYDFKGINKALGSNPKLVGKNLYKLKDASGLLLLQELINIAKNKNEGWLDYKWSHPKSKKIMSKTSYIKRIKGNFFVGAGIYK